jgi:Lrp/AsnC family transcriptional regulator, leucine-responsive regulatory protein
MVRETDERLLLDEVDRGILYMLQENARTTTHDEISAAVGVSPSTVRNRIGQLEDAGIIEGYMPQIDYERAGFPLHVQFVCTVSASERSQRAREALTVNGVVSVRETLTGERNLVVEAVATGTRDLGTITEALNDLEMTIHTSDIVTGSYNQPFNYFKSDSDVTEAALPNEIYDE